MELSTDEAQLKDFNAHPVKVTLQHLNAPNGQEDTEVVHAKFVVGADGAHSWVRRTMGIAMEGEQTEYIWGVIDMLPETDFPDIRNRCAIHSHNGSCMIIPREGDLIRLYIQLSDKDVLDPSTGRVNRNKIGPEKLLEVARKSLHPYKIGTPKVFEWSTIYIIGQRIASHFSVKERVFIVGDACHTHSPKAGQGMNASLNDSHNLVWKITHALRGWADVSLLKTYEYERRKYAQDLINFDKRFSALFSGKPRTEENQDGVSHEEFSQAFQTFGAFTSGIGIHYAESAIVDTKHQSFAKNLIIGQRMLPQILVRAADARPYELQDLLPADTRFKILIFAGNITDAVQRMKVEKLAEEMGRPQSFLKNIPGEEWNKVFDILAISSGKKEHVNYTELPELFRSHWSKVLIDDVDMTATQGGKAYENFGIDPSGALVIVRPDGYVGFVSSFESIRDVDEYFASFMKSSKS
jgi:phenol 2-monooxygenase